VIFGEKFISSIEKSERVSIPVLRLSGRPVSFFCSGGKRGSSKGMPKLRCTLKLLLRNRLYLLNRGVETQEYARVAKKGKPVF